MKKLYLIFVLMALRTFSADAANDLIISQRKTDNSGNVQRNIPAAGAITSAATFRSQLGIPGLADNNTFSGTQTFNGAVSLAGGITGDITTTGSLTTGSGGSEAGYVGLGQGTAPSTGTTAIRIAAPTSVTSYNRILEGSAGSTGLYLGTVSGTTVTDSKVAVGTGVTTALGVNVGTAGAVVVNGGALGTPSSGTLTNATGLPEAGLTLADNTTNNASTSNHGFLKKLDNNAAHYMDGTGAWSTPAGGGSSLLGEQFQRYATASMTGATWSTVGFNIAGSGSVSEVGDTSSIPRHLRYASAATTDNDAGAASNAFIVAFGESPTFIARAALQSYALGVLRMWIGEFSATPMASADPAINCAGFRYDTSAGDTKWQCVTNDGTGGGTITDSGVTADANFHVFKIVVTAATNVKFYIDGTLVATNTNNLPTGSCIFRAQVRTLENVAKNIDFLSLTEVLP